MKSQYTYMYSQFQTVFTPQINNLTFYFTTEDIYKKKKASIKQNLELYNCILQESCKIRDVSRDLFYLSGEITALEIAHLPCGISHFVAMQMGSTYIIGYRNDIQMR